MNFTLVGMTHVLAHRARKLPFFFSHFNFEAMKERGNTHFCFACLSRVGYIPDEKGAPTNQIEDFGSEGTYDGMSHHDESHKDFVLGNADKYDDPASWMEHEMQDNFPCVVGIT